MGLIAIHFSLQGEPFPASMAIIAGMVFDALDGAAARALGVSSDFGKELDALADVVTFGVAPAFLLLMQLSGNETHWVCAVPLLIFPICGALRLARFNSQKSSSARGFTGMPITAAGGILAVTAVYWQRFGVNAVLIITLLLALMMVSRLPYPDGKYIMQRILQSKNWSIIAVCSAGLIIYSWGDWILIPLFGYACSGIIVWISERNGQ